MNENDCTIHLYIQHFIYLPCEFEVGRNKTRPN